MHKELDEVKSVTADILDIEEDHSERIKKIEEASNSLDAKAEKIYFHNFMRCISAKLDCGIEPMEEIMKKLQQQADKQQE